MPGHRRMPEKRDARARDGRPVQLVGRSYIAMSDTDRQEAVAAISALLAAFDPPAGACDHAAIPRATGHPDT